MTDTSQAWLGEAEVLSIPAKRGSRPYRWLRWRSGSIYRPLFSCVFLANIAVPVTLFGTRHFLNYMACITAVTANMLTGLMFRNEHVVNLLFLLTPKRALLWLRVLCANVYAYGGIHSECGVAATFWYIAYLVQLARNIWTQKTLSHLQLWTLGLSCTTLTGLLTILVFAYPRVRVRLHDWFGTVHRFVGWTVVALFWAQIMAISAQGKMSLGANLSTPWHSGCWC